MKTIMILGASVQQIPFIKICKELGLRTVVVSRRGNYPGFNLADQVYYYDTQDKDNILQAARAEQICAITTDQTDVSVATVAYVAEKLGLRGIGEETAKKFTDKYEMRKAAQKAGIPVPNFDEAKNLDDALSAAEKIGYPVIIKPVDSSGSRGVFKVNNQNELKSMFEESISNSHAKRLVVESYICGKEYLADGFAMNYEYCTLDVGEKEYFNVPNIFVSRMCVFSSVNRKNGHVYEMVEETNNKLVKAFGLPFGITHGEYMYVPDEDKVYLIECAARGGGVYLSSDLTPMASGFDTNRALIQYLVDGKESYISKEKLDNKVSAWLCFTFPKGKISKIDGVLETQQIDGVKKVILDDIYVGMDVENLRNDSGKYGPVLLMGNSISDCQNIISKVRKTLKIEVSTENGVKEVIW